MHMPYLCMPPIHVLPHAARKHVPSPKPERAACPLRAPLPHHASSRPCADYEPRCARALPRAARGAVAGPWLGCGSALHALRAGGCDDSPYQYDYEATRFDLDSPYQYEATAAHEAARSPWQQQRAHYEEAYLARSMRSLTSAPLSSRDARSARDQEDSDNDTEASNLVMSKGDARTARCPPTQRLTIRF